MNAIKSKPKLKIQLELIEIIIAPNSESLPHLEKGDEMSANIHILVEEEGTCLIKDDILANNVRGQPY